MLVLHFKDLGWIILRELLHYIYYFSNMLTPLLNPLHVTNNKTLLAAIFVFSTRLNSPPS